MLKTTTKPKWPVCSQCGGRHAELKPGRCVNPRKVPKVKLQLGPTPSVPGSRLKTAKPKGKGR